MTVSVKGGTLPPQEIENYKKYLTDKYPHIEITELQIELDENDPDYVKLNYHYENKAETNIPFDRIRRITGYLVGTMNRWNDAKQAEEKDRVKHGISEKE